MYNVIANTIRKPKKHPTNKQMTFVSAFKVSICSNSITFLAIKVSKSTFHCIYPWNYRSLAISHIITKFYKIWMSSKHPLLTTVHSLLTLPHSGCISTPAPKQLCTSHWWLNGQKPRHSPHVFPLEKGHTDTSTGNGPTDSCKSVDETHVHDVEQKKPNSENAKFHDMWYSCKGKPCGQGPDTWWPG